MIIAVRFVKIDPIDPFRRSLVAFVFLRPNRGAAQRDGVTFQNASVVEQRQPTRGFLDHDSIGYRVEGQGIEIQVSGRREPAGGETNYEKKNQQNFQPRNYCGSIGRRARGSRSFVVAVLGMVTNGPPSSGALSEKATSGMLLGNPSSGNSFRNGK